MNEITILEEELIELVEISSRLGLGVGLLAGIIVGIILKYVFDKF